MHVEIILKNYRCFSDSEPAKFSLDKGFISFVGANNSGKSTILKFFYEFRDIFKILSDQRNLVEFTKVLTGQFLQFEKPSLIPSQIPKIWELFRMHLLENSHYSQNRLQ